MSDKDTEIEDLPAADLDTDLVDLDMDHDLGDTELPDLEASDELLDPFVGDSFEEDLNGAGGEHSLDEPSPDVSAALDDEELAGAIDDFEPDHLEAEGEGDFDDSPTVMAEEVDPAEAEAEEDLEPITLSEQELDNILGTGEDILVDLDDQAGAEGEGAAALDEVDAITPVVGAPADEEDFAADLEATGPADELELADVTSGETLTPLEDDFDAAPVDMGDDLGEEPVILDDLPDEISDDMVDADLSEPAGAPAGGLEDEDEEPVALSEAELDNILGDVDMADTIDSDDAPLPDEAEPATVAQEDDEDDEDITLSDDELSNVLLDTDELSPAEAGGPAAGAELDEPPPGDEFDFPDEAGPSILDDDEDDEPVTLSMEELGNIVSDVDTEEAGDAVGIAPLEAGDEAIGDDMPMDLGDDFGDDFGDLGDEGLGDELDGGFEAEAAPSILDDEDEDEGPVALSEDELSNILEDVDEEQAEDIAAPVAEEADEKNIIVLDEYEELGEAPPEAEPDELEAPAETPDRDDLVADTAAAANIDPSEVKKMISYLDGLFDQLPEETIRQFSKSEYFGLYKKIMGDLGLLK